ncbi:serine/threonine protein kinase [Plantactinospora alkalitolerans]|uniref:serine/threonine protein kinase n=1 Tax=Plantactinospora alkalitolerans TaxID=2789879 RepID=UPI001E5C9028|nr:serine/threonine-protein kinase [Plantactinospora alkalitolerans]
MTGDVAGAEPLRSTDPRRLGPCELLGRLGEGGMGTVYLARLATTGRMVAVKMIRPDLAHDAEFRRRFRGEVKRARQVPPFCTAEVLDADPDHEPPYLVAEYVDGPSLASVVADRGPLTSGNLHGLAVGMATALTAIHGAGVIHRDLKPSNVLLPPGSPKVIDFGIARAMAGTGAGTRTDQLIGTVAYMAPERFESADKRTLSPAADVFAWGAVVAYAGTGRTPFAAETPAATAVRILTQEPDLGGLDGPLRELVELALAKDPGERPTARELLDRLLGGGPKRSGALASALAGQPDLLAAAEQAQAVTEQRPVAETALGAAPHPDDELGQATTRQGSPNVRAAAARTRAPAMAGGPGPARTTTPAGPVVPPQRPAGPQQRKPVRRWRRASTVLLALVGLLGGTVGVGYATDLLPFEVSGDAQPNVSPSLATGAGTAPSANGSAAPTTPVPSGPPDETPWPGKLVVEDPLTVSSQWLPRTDDKNQVRCAFDDALVVTKRSNGPYRCRGPLKTWLDIRVEVEVTLVEPGSCAAIWVRFTDQSGGHALQICPDGYYLLAHGIDSATAATPAGTYRFPQGQKLNAQTPVRVGIVARGEELRFYRDGEFVGQARDAGPGAGRVVLGVFPRDDNRSGEPLYKVEFRDIKIEIPA